MCGRFDSPGSLLGYTIGELQFQRLSAQMAHELGSAFDVREFHNVELQSGPLPFAMIERNLEQWVAKKKSETPKKSG